AEWITGDRAAALERARSSLKRALAQRLDGAEARLRQVGAKLRGVRPSARLERHEAALARLELRLQTATEKRLAAGEQRLELAERSLRSISPFAVLERGYSITLDESGRAVRSAEDAALTPGARLKTKIGRGEIDSVIEAVRTDEDV
ncbi:MAG: exodeoxyribonuclease VII large subunit, partial [Planctomycetota bacterium]